MVEVGWLEWRWKWECVEKKAERGVEVEVEIAGVVVETMEPDDCEWREER